MEDEIVLECEYDLPVGANVTLNRDGVPFGQYVVVENIPLTGRDDGNHRLTMRLNNEPE